MSGSFESIYPDFLRTGLSRLHSLGVSHDLMALFAALEHYRRDLHEPEEIYDIIDVASRYVAGLNLFHSHAFYLVDPSDFSFVLTLCEPSEARAKVEQIVKAEIRAGKFAWALRQHAPVLFGYKDPGAADHGIFHALGVATHRVGMFCGLLRDDPAPAQEITFNLLSTLLGTCADAVAAARKAAALASHIKVLSGLLPICAWCRKVRDDQGYWNQIENYLESHTGATFSHGVCPECARQLLDAP